MASTRKRGKTWQYRIKYTDPITKDKTEVSKGGFRTKKEAELAGNAHEMRLASGQEVVTKNELLSEYLRVWLKEYKKDNVRKNTYILHERNIEKHIIPYFQMINLKEVTPLRYQKFINHLKEKKYSTRTIEIIHTTMYSAMQTAFRPLKKISENPCENVTLPRKTQKMADKIQYIDSDKISDFLFFARRDNYIYYMFFKTLIETGMRKGEAAALQRTDIDLKNGYISVNKTLDFQAGKGEELFGETKTYESNRRIKITNTFTRELVKHMDKLNDNKLVFNDIYRHDLDLVFCREDGNILPKSTLFNAFNRILKQAEIEKLPIHGLRHTHAVLLLESGAEMKFVQERLGHKSISITSDIYSHISTKIEKSSVEGYENYIQSLYD